MKSILSWFAATRFRMSLSHIPESMMIYWPWVAVNWFPEPKWAGIPATAAVLVWYWSRKKYECEVQSKNGKVESDAYTWAIGWFPWQWSAAERWDVALPTLFCLAISVGMSQVIN